MEFPQKEIHDSCAFSLIDNHQKQHTQSTEMLKKNKPTPWLRWQISKYTPFPPPTQENLKSNFLNVPQCQNDALHQY